MLPLGPDITFIHIVVCCWPWSRKTDIWITCWWSSGHRLMDWWIDGLFGVTSLWGENESGDSLKEADVDVNIEQPLLSRIVVTDSSHNVRESGTVTPTMSSLKSTMTQGYLTSCHVDFRPSEKKTQLMKKSVWIWILPSTRQMPWLFNVVRRCESNPFQVTWANCKGFVIRNSNTFKLSQTFSTSTQRYGKRLIVFLI